MKYLVVVCNGLTDEAIAEKDNRTPLTLADTPNLDRLARTGSCGSVQTIPEGLPVGGEVSYLALFGYAPEKYGTGAAEWEARALGLDVDEQEIPLCCDFVTLQSSHNDMIMKDFTAGRLAGDEARQLLDALQENIVDEEVRFHYGEGSHHLMLIRHSPLTGRLAPPGELIGEGIRHYMPQDEENRNLAYLMNQAQIILHNHALNKKRRQEGGDAVNSIWLSGNGRRVPDSLPTFFSRFEKNAAVITASLTMRGMAKALGMEWLPVPGATGFPDTDYEAKVQAALAALQKYEVVYVHVAGPEPVSLQGQIDDKVLALEDIDDRLVGPLMAACDADPDLRLLLVESHICSVNLMKYKNDPVPFVVYPSARGEAGPDRFDEEIVGAGRRFDSGPALIEEFFKGTL